MQCRKVYNVRSHTTCRGQSQSQSQSSRPFTYIKSVTLILILMSSDVPHMTQFTGPLNRSTKLYTIYLHVRITLGAHKYTMGMWPCRHIHYTNWQWSTLKCCIQIWYLKLVLMNFRILHINAMSRLFKDWLLAFICI